MALDSIPDSSSCAEKFSREPRHSATAPRTASHQSSAVSFRTRGKRVSRRPLFYEPSGRGVGGRGQPLNRFDRTAAFNELNWQFVYFRDPLVYPVNVTACCCSLARRQQALAAPR
jgi:hypothetical protein